MEGPPDDRSAGLDPGPPLESVTPALPAPPPPAPRKSGILFFCVVLAIFMGSGYLTRRVAPVAGISFAELFALLLPAIVVASGSNLKPTTALGLARRPPTSALLIALLLGLAAFLAAGTLMQLTALLLPASWLEIEAVERLFEGTLLQRAVLSVLVATLVPFCEEVAFRGWLLSAFRTRCRPGVAIACSALLFALLHGPARFTGVLLLGGLFGWLTWRAGSIWPAVIGHVVNNGLGVLLNSVGAAQFDVGSARPDLPQILFTAGVFTFALLVMLALARGYRRATPQPPPLSELLVRADPEEPSTRFALRRIPPLQRLALAAGVLVLAALSVLGARGH